MATYTTVLSAGLPTPSRMSITPTSTRKESARTLRLTWRSMKPATAFAYTIITTMATVIAMMMSRISGVMPTAVSTESTAKTMSITTICATTPANDALALLGPCSVSFSSVVTKISRTAL